MADDTEGLRPPPSTDPTELTTAALLREIQGLKEQMETFVRGENKLTEERFASVKTHMDLIERQRVEQKLDTKQAVDAALAAAKEAVKEQTTASERAIAKSEMATNEQLKQLGATFDAAFAGMRRDIDDLKQRVGKNESAITGT